MGYAFRAMWLIFCVFVRCTVLIIIIITKFLKLAQKECKMLRYEKRNKLFNQNRPF